MNISLKIDCSLAANLKKLYQKYQLDNPSQYIVFFAKVDDATISIFKSNKNKYSLTITSKNEATIKNILKKAKITEYQIKKDMNSSKSVASKKFVFLNDQIGSDEVGTGDFLGPIIVVASLVKKNDIDYLKELGVMDSKKIDDNRIYKIARIAVHKFPYSLLTVENSKYNELIKNGYNINQIKVLLHNQALFNLHKKYPNVKNIYVDQFTTQKNYYSYLKNRSEIVKNIYFHTKGESYFPSVALSSVIARYAFLVYMNKLNKKYHTTIPFGASEKVDEFSKEFIKKHGKKELAKIAKQNFKNYQRIKI